MYYNNVLGKYVLEFKKQIKQLQKNQLLYHYVKDCQKVDAKHQNQKAPLIKKGFNCKKTGFVLTLHTHKVFA
jgi:hypothetical protein